MIIRDICEHNNNKEVKCMSESPAIVQYTPLEEIFNSITHGIGALVSIAGLILLIVFSSL